MRIVRNIIYRYIFAQNILLRKAKLFRLTTYMLSTFPDSQWLLWNAAMLQNVASLLLLHITGDHAEKLCSILLNSQKSILCEIDAMQNSVALWARLMSCALQKLSNFGEKPRRDISPNISLSYSEQMRYLKPRLNWWDALAQNSSRSDKRITFPFHENHRITASFHLSRATYKHLLN